MGRPKKEINWEIVEKRMESGCTAREIAKHLRIDINTFYDRFKLEYECGFADFADGIVECGISDIKYVQHMKALSGNIQMLIFLGKVKAGQKEPEVAMTQAPNQLQLDQAHRIMELENLLVEERIKNENKEM